MFPVLRMGVQGPLYSDNLNNMRQLQETILLETNIFDIYVLNYIILVLNHSIYVTPYNCMKIEKSE
jgi:hypothetical protein